MPRCFILNRVSSDRQKDNLSITVQRILHPRIADQLGASYTKEDIFDLEVSSTTFDLAKWNTVKKVVASGRYRDGYAIFSSIDRYHRNKDEWFELVVYCLRFNITVVIPDTDRTSFRSNEKIPVKTYNADQFKDLIQLVFEIEEADNFKKKLRKRVKLAFSRAKEVGVDILGTGAPSFGHRWDPAKVVTVDGRAFGRWVIDPDEAKVVKLLFSKEFRSVRMAQWLNQKGYKSKKGLGWTSSYVQRVRSQLRLAGRMRNASGDIIEAKNVEPLVTYKEFLRVQQLTRTIERHHTINRDRFALVGFLRCGYCHDAGREVNLTRVVSARGNPQGYRMYCHGRKWKTAPAPCIEKGRGYSLPVVLQLVNKDLLDKLSNEPFLRKVVDDYRRRLGSRSSKQDLADERERLQRIERKIHNLTTAVADGFDRMVAIGQLNTLKAERDGCLSRLVDLEQPARDLREIPSTKELKGLAQELLRARTSLTGNPLLFRVHDLILDRIYVYATHLVIHYRWFGEHRVELTSDALFKKKIDVTALLAVYNTKTMSELCTLFNCTPNAIRTSLWRHGVKRNFQLKVDREEFRRQKKKGLRPKELARHFNINLWTAYRYYRKL